MGRPVVTSDGRLSVSMLLIPADEYVAAFTTAHGVKPSCWSLPGAETPDTIDAVSVIFARLPQGHEHAGMLAMWMNWTFGEDFTSIIACHIDTIEDLPLIFEDKKWRRDDRELLKFCFDQGLKQAMFGESAKVVD